ncbi:MAG: imidazole glycerol phosphate synthase subunit HisF [Actinomycetes bacterium]
MTLAVRIIPCLDINDGKVVKGVKFEHLKSVGDPVELAREYYAQGADELTFLDVTASSQDRLAILDIVSGTADSVFIPLTVGGGIRTLKDVSMLLAAGADKVSVGTAAVKNPDLLKQISSTYGNQILVVSLDIKQTRITTSGYELTTHGGRQSTGIDALEWIETHQGIGIGELLLNSMDSDGTRAGFDVDLISAIRSTTGLPLIASGGAGSAGDFVAAAKAGASAVLAASIFHDREITIEQVKHELRSQEIEVRL